MTPGTTGELSNVGPLLRSLRTAYLGDVVSARTVIQEALGIREPLGLPIFTTMALEISAELAHAAAIIWAEGRALTLKQAIADALEGDGG